MENNKVILERNMDIFLGQLLSIDHYSIEECRERFLEKYPNKERYFECFMDDYMS